MIILFYSAICPLSIFFLEKKYRKRKRKDSTKVTDFDSFVKDKKDKET